MTDKQPTYEELLVRLDQTEKELRKHKEKLKRVEEDFSITERRFNRLLENFPNGMLCIFDSKYRFLLVEGDAIETLGLEKKNLIGRTLTDVYPREVAFHLMKFLDGVWKGNKIEFEYDFKGETYLVAATPLKNSEGITNQMVVITQKITELKKIERQAKESEERYRTLFAKSSDPILLIEDGLFIECNAATVSFLGFEKAEDIVGKSPAELSPKYQPDGELSSRKAEKIIKRAMQSGAARFEWQHLKSDGSEVWVDVALTHIHSNGKERLYTVWRDINEAKEAREKLLESEEKNRAFSEATNEALFFTEEGTCIEANKAASKLFGYKNEEFIGMFGTVLVAEESKEKVERNMLSGYTEPYEAKMLRKDGSKFWAEIEGMSYKYKDKYVRATAIRDISERKQFIDELEKREEEFRNIFENAALGVFKSTPEGKYELVNETFAEILGFNSAEELLNDVNDISKLYKHPEDREKIKEVFAKQGFVKDYIVLAHHLKKDKVWISINANAQLDADGEVYYEGTIQDITEKKEAENALKKSEELLVQTGEVAKVGGWEIDVETSTPYWSEVTRMIHEVPDDYVPKLEEALEFYIGESKNKIQEVVQNAIENGE